jgi:hypothetical protein
MMLLQIFDVCLDGILDIAKCLFDGVPPAMTARKRGYRREIDIIIFSQHDPERV